MVYTLYFRLIVLCTLMAFTSSANAEERLVEKSVYDGRYRGVKITMVRELHDLGNKRFRLQAKAKSFWGTINESEEFYWQEDQTIQPIAYQYNQSVLGVKRKRSIKYDWQEKIALSIDKKKEHHLKLENGTLGPMTYQLKLRLDLADGKDNLEYKFVNREAIKHYIFTPVETLRITHKGTQIENALYVKRINGSTNKQTNLWFDVDRNFTIASLEHIKKDKRHRLFIQSNELYQPLTNTPYARFAVTQ